MGLLRSLTTVGGAYCIPVLVTKNLDYISIKIYLYIMNGNDVIKLLEKSGWKVLRVRGSHYRMGKDEKRTTVPVHGAKDLGKGLLASIERQTGVKLR